MKLLIKITEKSGSVLAVAVCGLSVMVLFMHLITHFPFFDEALRIRFLWLMSSGLKPNLDYFTPHPSLGYLLSLPFIKIFPVSAYIVLALRCLSLVIYAGIGLLIAVQSKRICNDPFAGLIPFLLLITAPAINNYVVEYSIDHISALAASGAFVLMFARPTLLKAYGISLLCTISVLIMPKYAAPLVLGAAGCFYSQYRSVGRISSFQLMPAAGFLSALFAVAVLFMINGMSLIYDLRHTLLLHFNLAASGASKVMEVNRGVTARYVIEHLFYNPVLAAMIILGVTGWIRTAFKEGGQIFLSGAGIIAGAILSSFLMRSFLEQYVTPVLLCFILYAPFAFRGFYRSEDRKQIFRLVLYSGAFVVMIINLSGSVAEFEETPYNARGNTAMHRRLLGGVNMVKPGIQKLNEYEELLSLIPKDESIAAIWPYHPIFRRDLTFVTFDDMPSHVHGLAEDDPMRKEFEPETFRAALEKRPPAFIVPIEIVYPQGWQQIAYEFIDRHNKDYVPYAGGYIRCDLLNPEVYGKILCAGK